MPANTCLYLIVSLRWSSVVTLSIFLIKIKSASISDKFAIRAPCPAGLNKSEPSVFLNSVLSGLTAIVSVDFFCSDIEILYFKPYLFSYSGTTLFNNSLKPFLCSGEIVK